MADDPERNEVQNELSKMTFAELQKLKEKLGSKVYNEAFFGPKNVNNVELKRANKNRPRECSSKRPEPIIIKKLPKVEFRDPRFDNLCGEFDDSTFRKNYKFLNKVRKKEKLQLIQQLKKEQDPDEKQKMRSVLQRIKNKERDRLKKEQKERKALSEREEKIRMLKEGKRPHFRTKLENKVANLVEQFSELKKKGKLQKHIEKQRKRIGQKDKKSGVFDNR